MVNRTVNRMIRMTCTTTTTTTTTAGRIGSAASLIPTRWYDSCYTRFLYRCSYQTFQQHQQQEQQHFMRDTLAIRRKDNVQLLQQRFYHRKGSASRMMMMMMRSMRTMSTAAVSSTLASSTNPSLVKGFYKNNNHNQYDYHYDYYDNTNTTFVLTSLLLGVSAAAAAAATTTTTTTTTRMSTDATSEPCTNTKASTSTRTTTRTTLCEGGGSGVPLLFVPSTTTTTTTNTTTTSTTKASTTNRESSLRRHQSIQQQMDQTATKVRNIHDTYTVDWDHPIGEGNFGTVHVGTHKITGETVAIKKISKQYTDNTSFQREMDALLHIQQCGGGHPNICSLREHYYDDNDTDADQYYYLIFDYISGNEMFDQLCTYGPYSEADTARLIQEITSALAYLHGIHIIHGDLKPENIMLSTKHPSDAIIKLVDFGCAQVSNNTASTTGSSTGSSHQPAITSSTTINNCNVARTIAYCPPEVITSVKVNDGRPIHPSFDMWALGVILYVMLTGVHPFDLHGTSSDEEITQHILSKQLPPIRNSCYTEHLSDDAITLMEQLLQWDPNQRLTADEVLQNPWVLGETARTDKITNSDKRLSKYRAFKSKLEAKVFADMISITTGSNNHWNHSSISNSRNGGTQINRDSSSTRERGGSNTTATDANRTTTLLEYAFHHLDREHKGYVTTKDLQKLIPTSTSLSTSGSTPSTNDEEELSLSGFTGLMNETLKSRYYPSGHIIYHEGDHGDAMFFLNSGAIEIYNTEGFHKVVKKPGDFFGEAALISSDGLRTASIRCITPVHVIEVGREYFDKFVNADYDLKLLLREMNIKRQNEKANAMLEVQQCLKDYVVYKDEYIYTDDNPDGDLYLLDEGHVDIRMNDQKVYSVKDHGDIFGGSSVNGNGKCKSDSNINNARSRSRNIVAQCKSDVCKLNVLHPHDFESIMNAHPSMKTSLRNLFYRREFQKAVCLLTQKSFPENEVDLRLAFDRIDINHSGKLELSNIRNAIQTLDASYTEQDVIDILASLDLDESGEVSWPEFKRIFGME